jgi:hypothetical protein
MASFRFSCRSRIGFVVKFRVRVKVRIRTSTRIKFF